MTESSLFVISEGGRGEIRDFVTGGRGPSSRFGQRRCPGSFDPILTDDGCVAALRPSGWLGQPQLTWCKMETKEENFSARWSSG